MLARAGRATCCCPDIGGERYHQLRAREHARSGGRCEPCPDKRRHVTLMCATHSSDDQPRGPNYLLANLRQPGPWRWKLERVLANTAIKFSRRQPCCGYPGEPGC